MTISWNSRKQNSAYGSTSDGPPEHFRGAVGFGRDSRVPFLARTSLGLNMLLRTARRGALAATALVLPAWVLAPTTTKYRIDQSLTQEIDATAAGGAKQRIAFSTSSFVTVTLADSAGGKTMRVVVDSMRG